MSRQSEISKALLLITSKLNLLNTAIQNLGGGSKDYASFHNGSNTQTGLNNTVRTLFLSETKINSSDAVFSLALNQLTILKAGDYRISFDTYINNSSTSRTEYSIWYELNGVESSGSRSAVYQRGYDSGQTTTINDIITVSAGDVLRFRVQRTDGGSSAGYQDSNGTRLIIQEL